MRRGGRVRLWAGAGVVWYATRRVPNRWGLIAGVGAGVVRPPTEGCRAIMRLMPTLPVEVLDIADPITATQIWEVQRAAYLVEADLVGFPGIPPLHETLDELVERPLQWLGIRDGKRVVVAAVGFTENGNAIDIDRLFVAPGSFRNGHARALVASLDRRKDATVSTARDNHPAKRLYELLGFVRAHDEEVVAGLTITHLKREAS